MVAAPLIFALAGLILVGFVLGYSGLGRRIRHPGGLYVQVAMGLGRPVGLGAATLSFFAYIALVTGLYGLMARTMKAFVTTAFGVTLPGPLTLLITVAIVMALSQLRVQKLSVLVLVVVCAQIVTVLWFAYKAVGSPAGGHVSFAALDPGWLLSGSFGVALVFSVSTFAGSEGGIAYSDELADPHRSIPKATYASYTVTTAVLILGAWAVSVVVGPEQAAIPGGTYLPVILSRMVGSEWSSTVVNFMIVSLYVGLIGSGVTLANGTARQVAGLALDGVLPRVFAPRREGAPPPAAAVLVQPLTAGAIAFATALIAPDATPFWVAVGAGLAIIGVMMLASASSAGWFLRGDADEGGFFGWEGQVIAGLFSVVTTGGLFFYGVMRLREVAPDAPPMASWLVGTLIAVTFGAGVIGALAIKASRPSVYAAIGGPRSTATSSVDPRPSANADSHRQTAHATFL